jgi:hypothetical protein
MAALTAGEIVWSGSSKVPSISIAMSFIGMGFSEVMSLSHANAIALTKTALRFE